MASWKINALHFGLSLCFCQ